MNADIARDVNLISRLPGVPTILRVVAQTTGMRFVAVARVTADSWTACAVHDLIEFGLKPGGQLELQSTICDEIRQHQQPVVFGNASAHPVFCDHHTPKTYGLQSYISVPIFRTDGAFFGTLCAIDPKPADLDDPSIVKTLELFGQLIAAQMDAEERLQRSDGALRAELDVAKLREQFIAVLGHDLRGPLQSIIMGNELLKRAPLDARWLGHIDRMERSCRRMAELIDNMLDLARGRLTGGIPVVRQLEPQLVDDLLQVIAEVQANHPDRPIQVSLQIDQPLFCDARRIAQLLANLLTNARTHGAVDQPILVKARIDNGEFELIVVNQGLPIAEAMRSKLFEPFARRQARGRQDGLGLGLYIAAEIARAHDGQLKLVSSDSGGTRFRFCMPLTPATD